VDRSVKLFDSSVGTEERKEAALITILATEKKKELKLPKHCY